MRQFGVCIELPFTTQRRTVRSDGHQEGGTLGQRDRLASGPQLAGGRAVPSLGPRQAIGQLPSRRGIFARGAGPTAAELGHGLLIARTTWPLATSPGCHTN